MRILWKTHINLSLHRFQYAFSISNDKNPSLWTEGLCDNKCMWCFQTILIWYNEIIWILFMCIKAHKQGKMFIKEMFLTKRNVSNKKIFTNFPLAKFEIFCNMVMYLLQCGTQVSGQDNFAVMPNWLEILFRKISCYLETKVQSRVFVKFILNREFHEKGKSPLMGFNKCWDETEVEKKCY